jgi:hypothetical protein
MKTNQERMEAKIEGSSENVQILRGNVWTSREEIVTVTSRKDT